MDNKLVPSEYKGLTHTQSAQSERKPKRKEFNCYPERDAPQSVGSHQRAECKQYNQLKYPKVNLRKPNNFFKDEIKDIRLHKSRSTAALSEDKKHHAHSLEQYQKRRLQELNQQTKRNYENYQSDQDLYHLCNDNLDDKTIGNYNNNNSSSKINNINEHSSAYNTQGISSRNKLSSSHKKSNMNINLNYNLNINLNDHMPITLDDKQFFNANGNVDSSKRLLKSKQQCTSQRDLLYPHSLSKYETNDSFESKVKYVSKKPAVKDKDEFMITLNPQEFNCDIWQGRRDDKSKEKEREAAQSQLAPLKLKQRPTHSNSKHTHDYNHNSNSNSNNNFKRGNNRKIINCHTNKDSFTNPSVYSQYSNATSSNTNSSTTANSVGHSQPDYKSEKCSLLWSPSSYTDPSSFSTSVANYSVLTSGNSNHYSLPRPNVSRGVESSYDTPNAKNLSTDSRLGSRGSVGIRNTQNSEGASVIGMDPSESISSLDYSSALKLRDKRVRSRQDIFHPCSSKQISDVFNIKK